MARINLLPWREAERKERQKEFGMMVLAGVLFSALAVYGVHSIIQSQIEAQNQRNNFLKQEIKTVEKQISEIRDLDKTKQNLLARMNIIQELQSSRPQIVHLFDEVVTTLPMGVYLDQIDQTANKVTFEGQAQSNARVSSMMRNIDNSEWLENPTLDFIESKEKTGTGYSHFKLTVKQASQTEEVEE
ncbi:MAG: PilN domain-containing protein [Candidatus Thiodiazotropha lotti]|uniref:PilN domain-containing protein n=1 Tax=Candidatus Thiodiazotropha lotti TaxID=2792787 RepID=A0A9E4K708_9GAMM|nr:PilN domain-containing protein [Candidatus Thiodiazotropha lotti]ODB99017.1 pilus assembly protein PilN [Candidatus Thiodiazotropha endoloripes]MCG7940243.1 PilN domain-containing protein [Candidatus Thiodiazotropha lotti]MCG7986956.1 PilN domain-containing protein [Candidatus Thiodiazotropha lotti]MCG8014191.1 PilN domain-containing protein [Candidatus Thiodiazotropha lotti]